jgi:MarR family transcriptional regulator, transcriptional regulator for hemolysin
MSETPALENIVAIITGLMAEMESRAFQDERFADLSMRQIFYFETILRMGHPTFSDLARQLNVTKPSVTAIVGKLIAMGYVQRVQDDEDRRSFHIVVTPQGEEFRRVHQVIHQQVVRRLTAQLDPDEVEQLTALLQKALQDQPA